MEEVDHFDKSPCTAELCKESPEGFFTDGIESLSKIYEDSVQVPILLNALSLALSRQ